MDGFIFIDGHIDVLTIRQQIPTRVSQYVLPLPALMAPRENLQTTIFWRSVRERDPSRDLFERL